MKRDFLKNMLLMVLVIVAICLVGRLDYNEEIIQTMSQGTYEAIVEAMPSASESDIVEAYMSNRQYWDSVGRLK